MELPWHNLYDVAIQLKITGKLGNFIEMLAANSSIFTILAISFERYYAICKPLKAGYKCTRLRAAIIIGIIWLLSCILTSPILIMAKSYELAYIDGSMVRNCILETNTYWNKMYVFISTVAFFWFPLLVLMLVYWLISRRLIRENVSMMDTTRDNLIDNGRLYRRNASEINNSSMSSSYVSFVFRKRFKGTNSRKSLLSLFKLNIRDGDIDTEQKPSGSQIQGLSRGSIEKPFNSIVSSRTSSPRKTVMTQVSARAARERGALRGGKALSLDYHANGMRNTDEEPIYVSEGMNGSLARMRSDSQSCWSANTLPNGQSNNFQSSLGETSSTNETTLSKDAKREIRHDADQRTVSLLSRLFSANLRFVRNLLNLANPSSKLSEHCERVDRRNISTHSEVNDGVRSKLDASTDHEKEVVASNRNMSTTSCDEKIIDYQEYNDGPNRIERISKKSSFDIGDLHSRLVDANDCAITVNCKKWTSQCKHEQKISERHQHTGKCVNKNQESGERFEIPYSERSSSSFKQSKRTLESNKNRFSDGRGSPVPRSRFKWIKGVSISSSTGSTRTNSTCLTSETGSMHNRHQNSPSPPRPAHQNQPVVMSKENMIESHEAERSQTCGRENIPEKVIISIADQQELVNSDETNGQLEENGRSRIPSPNRRGCRAKLDSRSSSVTYNEAENSYYSDSSSSPSLSIAADFTTTKSSWLESLLYQEQRNLDDVQQRRISLQEEEEQSNRIRSQELTNDLIVPIRIKSGQRLFSTCLDGTNGGQPLEIVVDEDEPTGPGTSLDLVDPEHPNLERCQLSEQQFAKTCELLDDTEPASNNRIGERKLDACDVTSKRHSHESALPNRMLLKESGCDVIVSTNPGTMTKVDLVMTAHGPPDKSQQKMTGQRSGSHPLVPCHSQLVNGVETHGLHPEFMAVRDISKKQQMDSRRQVVAMLAFVVACFFLLFFPYRVFTIWLTLSTEDQVASLGMETYYNITYFSRILIYLHSAINPIAYNLISTKFRRAFMSILLCRGAATRRNFNIDNRNMYRIKNHANHHNRSKIPNGSSNKALKTTNAPSCR